MSPAEKVTDSSTKAIEDGPCVNYVNFYGLETDRTWWDDETVRITYTLPQNTSVLFVVLEDDTVLGTKFRSTDGNRNGYHADGDGISLDEPLSGNHSIRVVVYRDVNGNGAFDPDADEPCRENGLVQSTGYQTIDFDAFQKVTETTDKQTTTA